MQEQHWSLQKLQIKSKRSKELSDQCNSVHFTYFLSLIKARTAGGILLLLQSPWWLSPAHIDFVRAGTALSRTLLHLFICFLFLKCRTSFPYNIPEWDYKKQNQYTSATVSLIGAKTLTLLCHFNIRTRTTIAGSDLPSLIYSSLMRCFHWPLMLYQGRWCSALPLLLFLLWYLGFYAMETQQQIDILMMKLFKLSKCAWGWFLALRFYSGLACTHARALIKENLTTAHVSVPFIPSPKSMKPIQGGDFFRHEPPPLPFRLLSLQPCVW